MRRLGLAAGQCRPLRIAAWHGDLPVSCARAPYFTCIYVQMTKPIVNTMATTKELER